MSPVVLYSHHTVRLWHHVHCSDCLALLPYCTEITIGIEPPINRTVTEGVNPTVEYCVVITAPDMSDPIERNDFNICVSTVDGTAMGKDNNCSTPLTPMYLFTP